MRTAPRSSARIYLSSYPGVARKEEEIRGLLLKPATGIFVLYYSVNFTWNQPFVQRLKGTLPAGSSHLTLRQTLPTSLWCSAPTEPTRSMSLSVVTLTNRCTFSTLHFRQMSDPGRFVEETFRTSQGEAASDTQDAANTGALPNLCTRSGKKRKLAVTSATKSSTKKTKMAKPVTSGKIKVIIKASMTEMVRNMGGMDGRIKRKLDDVEEKIVHTN